MMAGCVVGTGWPIDLNHSENRIPGLLRDVLYAQLGRTWSDSDKSKIKYCTAPTVGMPQSYPRGLVHARVGSWITLKKNNVTVS